MNCAIDATTSQQRCVGCIHDGINGYRCDVTLDYFQFMIVVHSIVQPLGWRVFFQCRSFQIGINDDQSHTTHDGNVGHVKNSSLKEYKINVHEISYGPMYNPVVNIPNSASDHATNAECHGI